MLVFTETSDCFSVSSALRLRVGFIISKLCLQFALVHLEIGWTCKHTKLKAYLVILLVLNRSKNSLWAKLCDLRDAMPRHWSLCFLLSPCYL